MGQNYYTQWVDGVTRYRQSMMDPPLSQLDLAITYATLRPMLHCDGDITWTPGTSTLAWSGAIRILFNREDGDICENTIATGSTTIADNEFAYVTLSETDGAAVTVSKAAVTTDAASPMLDVITLVLAYRNTASDALFPVWLPVAFVGGMVPVTLYDAHTILAATADDTPAALTVAEQSLVGRITGGNISALTAAQVRTLLGNLDGREQTITPADNVTIDWADGATALLTLNRASTEITLSNQVAGSVYRIRLLQDGTGSRVVTWADTIRWRGGSAPTLTTTADKVDFITLVYAGSAWHADASLNF